MVLKIEKPIQHRTKFFHILQITSDSCVLTTVEDNVLVTWLGCSPQKIQKLGSRFDYARLLEDKLTIINVYEACGLAKTWLLCKKPERYCVAVQSVHVGTARRRSLTIRSPD